VAAPPSHRLCNPGRMTTFAVLGTGIMGLPMARNAAQAALSVRAWNRTVEKARQLEDHGAAVLEDPADAVRGAEVVVTVLSDTDAVLETVETASPAKGTVWAQMSTVGLGGLERCADFADTHGLVLVDAPVLGTRQPAEAGQLTVLAGGPGGAITRCKPFFDAIATRTVELAQVGDATRLKLVMNHWVLGLVEATAETIALAEALGVNPHQWLDLIAGGPLDSLYAQMKGRMIMERSLEPAFKLSLAAKDAHLIIEAAELAGADAPLARLVAERMRLAIEAGHGDDDMAATYFASHG
jgi:3-hydroxyisobutyrate dehydrogenase